MCGHFSRPAAYCRCKNYSGGTEVSNLHLHTLHYSTISALVRVITPHLSSFDHNDEWFITLRISPVVRARVAIKSL